GRQEPALGALFLDDEPLILGHGVEADLQPVDAPAFEALDQGAAAPEQRLHLCFACLAAGRWIAAAAECVVADLEAAALGWRAQVEPDVARLVDYHRTARPHRALVGRQVEIEDDLAGRDQAAIRDQQSAG